MRTKRLVRVFPRRTSLTPTDVFAFVGLPPMIRPAAHEVSEVHISATFTWDIKTAQYLAEAWQQHYPVVKVDGPAFGSAADGFVPGRYVKEGVTFSTRGCNRCCPWCLVPVREGRLSLLPIVPGHIVNDNNLLQAPREHQSKVYEMLRGQKQRAVFPGGFDARLVDAWVAKELQTLRIQEVFLAADTPAALAPLAEAVNALAFLKRHQLRCYVLLGFNGQTLDEAQAQLQAVWDIGCLPFAQLYQPPDKHIDYPLGWRHLQRLWSRPAATVAYQRQKERGA